MERVCPLLGLAGDRHAAVDGVDAAHRCHAELPPAPLDRATQSQLCLTVAYDRCERYLAFMARAGSTEPGRSRFGDGLVSTRLLLAPQPAWRGMAGRARGSRAATVIVVGAGLAVAGVATAALAGNLVAFPAATERATPSPSVEATLRPTARATPTAPPTPSPTPLPTATPVPLTPTPVPTPVPTAARTYTVVQGDTLAAIAQRFGVSVGALQAANGIADPDEIIIGQVLTIP